MPLQGAAILLQDAGMPTPLQHLLGSCQVTVQQSPLLTALQGEVLLFIGYCLIEFVLNSLPSVLLLVAPSEGTVCSYFGQN